ncbi:BLOC-2 complex member HPS3-like isoform X2 [Mercenaria mercenaria]|nr:BLOC-2 complex member HPS3-like isoform X2 [Mercenaria mercenaria]
MTSCQQTGNLGIVFSRHIKLYHLVEKTIPNSQTTFLDVILFLELQFQHSISHISLCEDFVACSSSQFVQVFQVNISNEDDDLKSLTKLTDPAKGAVSPNRTSRRISSALSSLNIQDKLSSPSANVSHVRSKVTSRELPRFSAVGERGSSTPSPALTINPKVSSCAIEDDTDFIHWTFSTGNSMTTETSQNQSETGTENTTIELKGLKNLGKELKPEPSLPEIKDLRGGNHLTTGKATLTQLMFQYLDKSDVSWIHLQLIPTYLIGKDDTLILSGSGVPLRSSRRSSLAGMSCLMSGSRAGFMFSLLPQPSLLSIYKYSSDAIQVQTNGKMLFVLVQNGLEVYTTRCLIAAVHNTEHFDYVRNACPQSDTDICMCGVQQFLGPREITLTNKHVVLFNKMDNAWNINLMEEPSTPELYQDLLRFGERYQQNAPHTYHHLLLECHMTLKSSLVGQTLSQSEVSVINDLLHESSALLGEYYASPDCMTWQLCLPYYNMSGLSLIDVVRQAVQLRQHNKQVSHYGEGLVQFLRYTLFLDEDPLDIKQGDGDLVLEVCHDCMVEKLADIILFSRLKTFSPKKALKLLKGSSKARSTIDSKSRTKERLAFVSLNLRLCEPDIAVSSLSSIDKSDLIETCIDNPQILHTSMTEFSPLSQLLRCNSPKTLISILVMLHDKGTMSMDLAIRLLQGRSGVLEIHKNTHIREYLEALVNDECRKFSFDEAVPLLCEIYLQRLKEWEPPSIRQLTPSMKFRLPSGSGHFGRRHSWLDNIPPFSGAKSITSTCKYVVPASSRRAGVQPQLLQCHKIKETCSCFLCNEDLLKLQALLCYSEASSIICDKVMASIENQQKAFYFDSLAILCLMRTNYEQSLTLVVDKHTNIAADFGASVIKDNAKQWEYLLKSLLSGIGQNNDVKKCPDRNVSVGVIKDVLREMAHQLKPEVFISVLPGNGNFFFFLPFIQHCLDTHKSNILKDKILSLGENLTQSVNSL